MPVVIVYDGVIPVFINLEQKSPKHVVYWHLCFLHNDDVMETLRVCIHWAQKRGEYYYMVAPL